MFYKVFILLMAQCYIHTRCDFEKRSPYHLSAKPSRTVCGFHVQFHEKTIFFFKIQMNLVHERIVKKPVFVIKFGPPASGKSTIVSKCFPLLAHKSIGINDYVERNTGFVQNSLRLARQTPGFSGKLAAGNANLAKKGIDVYMTYRKLYSKQHN